MCASFLTTLGHADPWMQAEHHGDQERLHLQHQVISIVFHKNAEMLDKAAQLRGAQEEAAHLRASAAKLEAQLAADAGALKQQREQLHNNAQDIQNLRTHLAAGITDSAAKEDLIDAQGQRLIGMQQQLRRTVASNSSLQAELHTTRDLLAAKQEAADSQAVRLRKLQMDKSDLQRRLYTAHLLIFLHQTQDVPAHQQHEDELIASHHHEVTQLQARQQRHLSKLQRKLHQQRQQLDASHAHLQHLHSQLQSADMYRQQASQQFSNYVQHITKEHDDKEQALEAAIAAKHEELLNQEADAELTEAKLQKAESSLRKALLQLSLLQVGPTPLLAPPKASRRLIAGQHAFRSAWDMSFQVLLYSLQLRCTLAVNGS